MTNPGIDIERRIVNDPDWQEGAAWGRPRRGHPEGRVSIHIDEVLANIDRAGLDAERRRRLRFVALVHDTFKYQVDFARPRTGENHHAVRARRFAERFTDDQELLEVIELHDEAFNAWQKGNRRGDWVGAEKRAEALIDHLGPSVELYLQFYAADNATGSKTQAPLRWFEDLVEASQRQRKER